METFAATLEVEGEALQVVVKRPRPQFAKNDAFCSAMLAWGEAQKELDHENLVGIFEAGRTSEGIYVIQEKVEGASLGHLLTVLRKKKRALTPQLAMAIVQQVAKAIAFLHERGIAHGAIDPGEVLISYDGEVKLGDQRLHELDAHTATDLLEDSSPADPYRAPERAQASGAAQPPGDVYAFALLILELLIGSPVWTSESMTIQASLAALRDFTPIGQAQPKLTEALAEGLAQWTAANPAERPATAAPLRALLDRLTDEFKISAEPEALGTFVQAALPPPEAEEAPTMMVDPAKAEELAQAHQARQENLEGASVAVDPDFAEKALAGLASVAALQPEPPAASELATLPPGSQEPPKVPQPRVASAPPASRAPSKATPSVGGQGVAGKGPMAPSVKREVVKSIPNVARVAPQERSSKPTLLIAGLLAAVIGLLLYTVISKESPPELRTVRLRLTSQPEGATISIDGRSVGVTPFDQPHEVSGPIKLRFELPGHEPHELSIGTQEAELRYQATLKALDGS